MQRPKVPEAQPQQQAQATIKAEGNRARGRGRGREGRGRPERDNGELPLTGVICSLPFPWVELVHVMPVQECSV